MPDAETERRRRLVARRNQIVRHRTRVKNETHAVLAAHLVPPCPHAELFNGPGRAWLGRQVLPDDERAAIERHLRELDRLGEDLAVLDRAVAEATIDEPSVRRLLTITGVNVTVAAGLCQRRRENASPWRSKNASVGVMRRAPRGALVIWCQPGCGWLSSELGERRRCLLCRSR